MDGITLSTTISATVVSTIVGVLVTYWKTKQTIMARVQEPLSVNITEKFATREELRDLANKLGDCVTKAECNMLKTDIESLAAQIKTNDERDESRIRGVHKRIDELMKIMLERNRKS